MGLNLWWSARKIHGPRGVLALALPFFGTNRLERLRALATISSLTSPFLIWEVEGHRAGNATNPLAFPIVFGAAVQVLGIDIVAPVYCLISTFCGPGHVGPVSGQIDPDVAHAVLPATLAGHVLPALLMSVLPLTATEVSRSHVSLQSVACVLFYSSPITVSALTRAFSEVGRWFRERRNAKEKPVDDGKPVSDRQGFQTSEGAALKIAYGVASALQAALHLVVTCSLAREVYTAAEAPSTAAGDLVSNWISRIIPRTLATGSSLLSFRNTTLAFGLYTIWDLRRRGNTTTREALWAAMGFLNASVFCGPGAGYAGLWYWRECVRGGLGRRRTPFV